MADNERHRTGRKAMSRFRTLLRAMVVAAVAAATTVATLPASAQTTDDIIKKGKIVIGTLTGIPPYDTIDANGNTAGFLVDLAQDIGKALGVKTEIVPVNNASRAAAL